MTRRIIAPEALKIIRTNKSFLSGVTLSGGEATLQLKWVIALFEAIKADWELAHLTRFVDTNGHLGTRGWPRLLPVTDGVMLDITACDEGHHRSMTGKGNARVLPSGAIVQVAAKLFELRFLMLPEVPDGVDEIDALATLVARLVGGVRVRLNAF